jgi:hypothetical protein
MDNIREEKADIHITYYILHITYYILHITYLLTIRFGISQGLRRDARRNAKLEEIITVTCVCALLRQSFKRVPSA